MDDGEALTSPPPNFPSPATGLLVPLIVHRRGTIQPPSDSHHPSASPPVSPDSILSTPVQKPSTRRLPLLSGHPASDLSEFSRRNDGWKGEKKERRRKKKEKRSDNLDAQRGRAPCSFPRGKLKQREIRLGAGLFSWISLFLENQLRALHLMYKNHLFTSDVKTMMISGLRIKVIACLFVRLRRNLLVLGVEALQHGSCNLSF